MGRGKRGNHQSFETSDTYKMKKILVRFDDICPTMDFHQFQIAMELMDKHNVKPLLGVIPDCQDPGLMLGEAHSDFWSFVKSLQAKGYTVAMHGSVHVFDNHARGMVVSRWDSEFAGHPYEVQLKKIRKGKEILESHGIYTDIFFAPGHSYDSNTLKALAACGFKYMSDGKSEKPYERYGVKCIPCRSGGVPGMRFGEYHTAVLHAHEWARPEGKRCYNQFVNLLNNHKQEIVTWNEYIKRPLGNQLVQRMNEYFYVRYQRHLYPLLGKILKIIKR